MKRLILMRHAKSSWAVAGQPDVERPLNERGRRGAAAIGAWLAAQGMIPGAALVSAAARTRETWALLGPGAEGAEVRFRPELYHAEPARMLLALRGAPEVDRVLMLGHMPGIGAFARAMLAEPPADPEFGRYPTAATAVIDLDLDRWAEADVKLGRLVAFVIPGVLNAAR